jgi:hypothetical protein
MAISAMIVDDSLIMTQKLTILLRELGHDVVRVCKDGAEAVRVYPIVRPDAASHSAAASAASFFLPFFTNGRTASGAISFT